MTEPRAGLSRRRVTLVAAAVLALVLVGGVVAAVQLRPAQFRLEPRAEITPDGGVLERTGPDPAPVDPAGDGLAVCVLVSIAVAGPLTGVETAHGAGIRDGVRLAVDDHNDANPGCQVQLKELDTGGDGGVPEGPVRQIVEDVYTIGLIGPASSDIVGGLRHAVAGSGLVTAAASPAPGGPAPAGPRDSGRTTMFRGIAGLTAQGAAAANYLTASLGSGTICVVDDGSPYGTGLVSAVTAVLGAERVGCGGPRSLSDNNIDVLADSIGAIPPDAVFFGGSADRAGELLARLRDRGIGAAYLSTAESDGTAIFRHVGDDPQKVMVSLPYGPEPGWFVDEFTAKFRRAPGGFAAIGYDLATIMLRGIDAGALTRPQMADWMSGYDGQGVARHYRWAPDGELADPTLWLYDVRRQ